MQNSKDLITYNSSVAYKQQMFDPGIVMVPSAGCPTAVSLWVPALRASCLREGGTVSGCYDTEV